MRPEAVSSRTHALTHSRTHALTAVHGVGFGGWFAGSKVKWA